MELGDALAWLDRHQNLERMLAQPQRATPEPARMARLVHVLGDPQLLTPTIHVTGTNGKTSTVRAIAQLLAAKGLSVGTFTSPHLEAINERITAAGEPIPDEDLAEVLSDIAALEPMVGELGPPTWFEIMAAAAFRWFADRPVDVAVVEVGMGGRWDATNVVEPAVSVVTNVGLDHTEFLGPSRADIAREKAGIAKPGAVLVLGERDRELRPIFEREASAGVWLAGRDFSCTRNDLAVGGRVLDVRVGDTAYEGVWLDLHGRHQGDNFAIAMAATTAFFAAPLEDAIVRNAAASLASPGRMEVVGRRPLVVLDGAKNPDGARSAATTVAEEFGDVGHRILVVGLLAGKEAVDMLEALGVGPGVTVVACAPPSPRAQPAEDVAAAARALGATAIEAGGVAEALDLALRQAAPDDLVLVTGSLYVVGAARGVLAGRMELK